MLVRHDGKGIAAVAGVVKTLVVHHSMVVVVRRKVGIYCIGGLECPLRLKKSGWRSLRWLLLLLLHVVVVVVVVMVSVGVVSIVASKFFNGQVSRGQERASARSSTKRNMAFVVVVVTVAAARKRCFVSCVTVLMVQCRTSQSRRGQRGVAVGSVVIGSRS